MEDPTEVTADRLLRDLLVPNRNSTSNVNFTMNAGGLVTAACAFMLGVNIVLCAIVIKDSLKIEDLDDKLSAIYMMAPHLKPPEKSK